VKRHIFEIKLVWRELSTLQAATFGKLAGWRKINVIPTSLPKGFREISFADLASFRLKGGSNINKQKGNTS